jgi:hypothetical protein
MLGHEQKLGDERESVRKVAETMLSRVSSIFGTNIASWSEQFQKQWMDRLQSTRDLQKAKYRAIVDVYEHALKSAFDYVISLPVRESFSKNPEYYLTFCSRHPDALVLMADFMCREEEALYKSEGAEQTPLFAESAADGWKKEQEAVHCDAEKRLLQRLTPQFQQSVLLIAQVLMECGRPITTTEWREILNRLEIKDAEISKPDRNHVMRWMLRRKQSP